MSFIDPVYCRDDDVANAAGADFALLLPDAADVAFGIDGLFDASDRWTLTSVSSDFAAQGVTAGQVCSLSLPAASRPHEWTSDGELFVVDVTPTEAGSVTLRRLRANSGQGVPPSPAAGLSGVTFAIKTLFGKIEEASFELNRELGIDANIPGRSPSDLRDVRDLRMAVVEKVLCDAYFDQVRSPDDVFAKKHQIIKSRLDRRMARLSVRWSNDDQETQPAFGTRLER